MTRVILCADHTTPDLGPGLGFEVEFVPRLCTTPRLFGVGRGGPLVVGVHPSELDLPMLQAELRRHGLDPLGVPLVDLTAAADAATLRVTLAGATARARAFPGSQPEHIKLLRPRRLSRRAFLALGSPVAVAAPWLDHDRCVAGRGCRTCVDACPAGALRWVGGAVDHDKGACVACGICVTTCPVGAIENPAVTPTALEAQVRAIVATGGRAVAFVCRDAERVDLDPGWIPVAVPCTGMVTAGWLLAPLVIGVAAVTALPCEATGCPLSNGARVATALNDARAILKALGLPSERIGTRPADDPEPLSCTGPEGLFGAGSDQRVIAALAEAASVTSGGASLAGAAVGSVAIRADACTACARCAQSCPVGALQARQEGVTIVIDFDPASCVACGQCERTCPELGAGAIEVTRGFQLEDWNAGRRRLREDQTPMCVVCGAPVAPGAMLRRIVEALGPGQDALVSLLSSRCTRCRGR